MDLKISGTICPNDYAWYYDWFGMDYTCPSKVQEAINDANGDTLNIEINSPGGEIASGSDIYTMLREYGNVNMKITGQACSAASVIAMAGHCEMSPTALMMVHCVSSQIAGNHNDMEKMAEVLKTADKALCTAYMAKSDMTEAEALDMMEEETWLTAEQALKYGLIDGIMFEQNMDEPAMVASLFGLPTDEELARAKAEKDSLISDILSAVCTTNDDDEPELDDGDTYLVEPEKLAICAHAGTGEVDDKRELEIGRARLENLKAKTIE